jgi:hypothetical protein
MNMKQNISAKDTHGITREPTEQGKDSRESINTLNDELSVEISSPERIFAYQDSSDQLPTWHGESSIISSLEGSSQEDQPVFGEGDFEEDDFLRRTEVLDDTASSDHGNSQEPSTSCQHDSENGRDDPDLW